MENEQPGHRQPRVYPFFSKFSHCAFVVRNDDPSVIGSPLKDNRI